MACNFTASLGLGKCIWSSNREIESVYALFSTFSWRGRGRRREQVAGFVLLTLEQDGLDNGLDTFEGGLDTDGLMGSIAMGQPNCIRIVWDVDEMRQIALIAYIKRPLSSPSLLWSYLLLCPSCAPHFRKSPWSNLGLLPLSKVRCHVIIRTMGEECLYDNIT